MILFGLTQHSRYSVQDIENMYPFERDLFTDLRLKELSKIEGQ
jgi:hypothetical protein